MPDCMQTSVAPNSTASSTRRTNSSSECSYASGERRPCPKPQNAQPTTQMFETLMLRLTTNVTRSPASSERSPSATCRMSSIASGRVSAKSAVSSSSPSGSPARGRDGLEPPLRVLGRRASVDLETGVHRLEHEPLGGRHLAQPGEVLAPQDAQVRMREHAALERPLARPGHVRGEV